MGSERKSVLRKLYTVLLLAKSCVCQHLQLPAREYLTPLVDGEAPNKLVAGTVNSLLFLHSNMD